MKFVVPSVRETAFNCPHCSALARQYWYSGHAHPMEKDNLPWIVDEAKLKEFTLDHVVHRHENEQFLEWAERLSQGQPFFEKSAQYREIDVNNVWFSQCFNCDNVTIWLYDQMLYPKKGEAPVANSDMPDDIRRDYNEASAIMAASPRGAAALIRLAIQKLCIKLGQSGKNLNDDIGALVKSGLDLRVQQALDAVRVIGNNAVHPGQFDLRDDRATAETLFRLLNLIVDKMISEPKHVKEIYDSLPTGALKAIEKRDADIKGSK